MTVQDIFGILSTQYLLVLHNKMEKRAIWGAILGNMRPHSKHHVKQLSVFIYKIPDLGSWIILITLITGTIS